MNSGVINLNELYKLQKLFRKIYNETSYVDVDARTLNSGMRHIESILIDLYVLASQKEIVESKAFDNLQVSEVTVFLEALSQLRKEDKMLDLYFDELKKEFDLIENFLRLIADNVKLLEEDIGELKEALSF